MPKIIKKTLLIMVAFLMLIGGSYNPGQVQARTLYNFTDLEDHWAEESVSYLYDRGFINGYQDQTFRPDTDITRAEFLKILLSVNSQQTTSTTKQIFSDVSPAAWHFPYVAIAFENNWIKGYEGVICTNQNLSSPCFLPNASISREEAAVIVYQILGYPSDLDPAPQFLDLDITNWSYDYVTSLTNRCVFNNVQRFNPNNNLTRAEAAKIIYYAYTAIEDNYCACVCSCESEETESSCLSG
jgi:hypothetical protein